MKTCSKCKKYLPKTHFVKSPRYHDSLYPICKDCRRVTRIERQQRRLLCSYCHHAPHAAGHDYCERCLRIAKGRSPIRKTKQAKVPGLCPNCNLRPRLKNYGYCLDCRREKVNQWMKEAGGAWQYLIKKGERNKALARAAVNRSIRRGKLKRKPCEACGNLKSEAHHFKGYEREFWLEVKWLCKEHHDQAERILKSLLTEQPLLL